MIFNLPILNSYGNILENRIFSRKKGGIILLYHRVADVKKDPYSLCISNKKFEQQIKWLKNNFNIISTSHLVDLIREHKLNKNFVCLTFDDGYRDNYVNAFPVLKKYKVPATFFVTSGYANTNKHFFWDDDTDESDKLCLPMTVKQLKELADSNLIEIGSHTINHPHLSRLTPNGQEKEIGGSKKILERYIKREVRSFSYPFGTFWDINKTALETVRKSGYEYACANFSGKVFNFTNAFSLPRIIIRNWDFIFFKKTISKLL